LFEEVKVGAEERCSSDLLSKAALALSDNNGVIERGVLSDEGRIFGRAQAAVRSLSSSDFDRIIAHGLDDRALLLPRTE
jgi:putative restriction endonuclease